MCARFESVLTRFIVKDKVSRLPFFSIAHVLLTYKIFEMKIPPEIGISLCRLTFSHRPFTKSGILPTNSVISEVMIAFTELKTQKLSEHATGQRSHLLA